MFLLPLQRGSGRPHFLAPPCRGSCRRLRGSLLRKRSPPLCLRHLPGKETFELIRRFRFSVPASARGPAPVPHRLSDEGYGTYLVRSNEKRQPREAERVPARGRGRRRYPSATCSKVSARGEKRTYPKVSLSGGIVRKPITSWSPLHPSSGGPVPARSALESALAALGPRCLWPGWSRRHRAVVPATVRSETA